MNYVLLISMPGGGELIILFVIVLLLFGGRKIPELMKGIGKGVKEFDDARKDKNDGKAGEKSSED